MVAHMDFKRIRNFLGLRQIDVAMNTGISVCKLSSAENRRVKLNPTEQRALESFLTMRLRLLDEETKGKAQ
jgi:transcriptional regulator with XRE-family HTH domain